MSTNAPTVSNSGILIPWATIVTESSYYDV